MAKPIFTLDEDAVKVLEDSDFNLTVKPKGAPEYTLGAGTQFALISRDSLEARATMIDPDTGKPKRGRPRRFPASLVARLLGESSDNASGVENAPAAATEAETNDEAVVVASATVGFVDKAEDVEVEVEFEEQTEEEKEAQEARVASLFNAVGDEKAPSDDW